MAVTVGGKPMDDTIFYYWAIASLSRALRFRAEAAQQLAQPCGFVLAAIATYYSLFHLGVFLTFCVPRYLRPEVRTRLDKRVQGGGDPRRAFQHIHIKDFLADCELRGLHPRVRTRLVEAEYLRIFVNYGPDLTYTAQEVRVANRGHVPQELINIANVLDDLFVDAVTWVFKHHSDDKLKELISAAIDHAEPFFTPNRDGDPFYSEWSTSTVLEGANKLRLKLASSIKR